MQHFEVIVVGAGAAGLVAAIRAAELGRQVLLLEKTPRAGTKILMSGGTRCNITHDTDERGIVEAFGKPGKFLHSALAALSPRDVIQLFHDAGVATKTEPGGKIFPVSDNAADVLDALLRRLRKSGCELALSEPLKSIERSDKPNAKGFVLHTEQRRLNCDKLIVTTGGKSYPGSGTTGDGYAWMQHLGHTIVPPRPALTPVTSNEVWLQALKGVTLDEANLAIIDPSGKKLDERRGGFLFTHFGLSGPVALDISRTISGYPAPHELRLVCDFLPSESAPSFSDRLQTACQQDGKKQLASILSQLVPRRLAEAVFDQAMIDPQSRAAELSKKIRTSITSSIKSNHVSISGTRGFKKAEVTAGGVSLKEVDSRTMQSRVCPNLYIAGELLDLDGPIGGYNFQAAFSTAWLAGQSV